MRARATTDRPAIGRTGRALRRLATVLHKWLGAAVVVLVTLWFLSGIVMMYWTYPSVEYVDYLQRSPRLDPAQIRITAAEAFAQQKDGRPAFVTLASLDGRPAYFGGPWIVYADDGSEHRKVDQGMLDRAAAAWTGQPVAQATRESIVTPDQWTLGNGLRNVRPLYKYSWPDGQQVYVDGRSADVVQYTTSSSRFWAYLGAIPHWLYLPALRTGDGRWHELMVWTSLGVTAVAMLGIAVAVWRYSPTRRYRRKGAPASLPYSGWKRWHALIGLTAGGLTITWAFSGFVSLEPFRLEDRLTALTIAESTARDHEALQTWIRVSGVLLDRPLEFAAYAPKHPRDAVASIPDFEARELRFASIEGAPVYVATDGEGQTRIVPVHGEPTETFDPDALMRRMREAGGPRLADVTFLEQFDAYYRDRRGRLTLPVIRARMDDSVGSRYYVNPATASVVWSYSSREWVDRWLHHGLHSFDLPWLYNHRPLWDVVMLALLLSGTALCVTSLVLTYRLAMRTVGAPLIRFLADDPLAEELDRQWTGRLLQRPAISRATPAAGQQRPVVFSRESIT